MSTIAEQEVEFRDAFAKADKVARPVEKQWHYPIMTEFGFKPVELEAVGFVRRYNYVKGDRKMVCVTGVNADYWEEYGRPGIPCGFGYWSALRTYLVDKEHS